MLQTYDDPITERVDDFNEGQLTTLRWVSVSSSIISILFGLVFLYLYINMRYKVFRHHLIFLLIFFDFGKAIVLLWYPARVLSVPSSYNNVNFCDVVGWFTSSFIEGADFAVLALAIHTALLVFRRPESTLIEGGLYKVRFYVYGLNILLPALLASLAFIHDGRKSYLPYITWCYLPVRPIWYRLVLSWIPRYLILIAILAIYLAIYIHVKLEYSRVVDDFQRSQTFIDEQELYYRGVKGKLRKFACGVVAFLSYFPGLGFLDNTLPSYYHGGPRHNSNVNNNNNDEEQQRDGEDNNNNTNTAIMEFQRDSVVKFQFRRSMIERQIKSIFVYPFAYFLLWLAPFILQCLQYDYVIRNGPVYWITALSAFMQPFNCAVDTTAFMIREKPWRNSEEKIFTKQNGEWVKKRLTFTHEGGEHDSSFDHHQQQQQEHQQHHTNEKNYEHSDDNNSDPSPRTILDKHGYHLKELQCKDLDEQYDYSPTGYYEDEKKSTTIPASSRSTSAASKSPKTTNNGFFNNQYFSPPAYPPKAHLDPFGHTTANKVDLPPKRPFVESDRASTTSKTDSEKSMDLMEFLS